MCPIRAGVTTEFPASPRIEAYQAEGTELLRIPTRLALPQALVLALSPSQKPNLANNMW